jgi:hypothetical protein
MQTRDAILRDQVLTLKQKAVELHLKYTGASRKERNATELEDDNSHHEAEEGGDESILNTTFAEMQREINKLKLSNARLQLQRESDLHATLVNGSRIQE